MDPAQAHHDMITTETLIADMRSAVGLLTRIPAGDPGHAADHARAAWAYPFAGAVVGLGAALGGTLALDIGAPPEAAAALALLALVLSTGGLHEDGLADSADGLWGAHDRERALAIMKDSHIGAFGTIALSLFIGARLLLLLALLRAGGLWMLPAIGAASRFPMTAALAAMPNARGHGLSASVGRPGKEIVLAAGLVTLVLALLFAGLGGVAVALWSGVAALPILLWAGRRLGGQTGDVLGAAQQCAELAGLAAAITTLS